jgi:hypothetical protein
LETRPSPSFMRLQLGAVFLPYVVQRAPRTGGLCCALTVATRRVQGAAALGQVRGGGCGRGGTRLALDRQGSSSLSSWSSGVGCPANLPLLGTGRRFRTHTHTHTHTHAPPRWAGGQEGKGLHKILSVLYEKCSTSTYQQAGKLDRHQTQPGRDFPRFGGVAMRARYESGILQET